MRILLLISSLEHGGAERQVVQLANRLDPKRFEVALCSLSDRNALGCDLRERDRRLFVIPKRWRYDVTAAFRVAELMRRLRTQLVHAFLFDAEIVARLAGRMARVPVIVGSERNTDYRRPLLQRSCLRLTQGICDLTVANSRAGRRFAVYSLGVDENRVEVVHNGVDVDRFCPGDGSAVRAALNIAPDEKVVGMVASFKPQKNHPMFLRVVQQVLKNNPRTRFLCVGEQLHVEGNGALSLKSGAGFHGDTRAYQGRVSQAIHQAELGDRVLFLGHRDDMTAVYRACDLTILTSRHEGTPNVVLESMACGVPVVITDVSDNALIVGGRQGGYVVPVDGVRAMADRICELLNDSHQLHALGRSARVWVEQEFSAVRCAAKMEALYERLLHAKLSKKHRTIDGKNSGQAV